MRLAIPAFVAALAAVVLGTAVAFPPVEVTKTDNSITLSNLDCATRYKVKVAEREGDKWTQAKTVKRRTNACAPPPPAGCDPKEKQMKKLATAAAVAVLGSASGCYPNPATTGTPMNWVPQSTTSSNVTLSTPGQVYHDVELIGGADINVTAPNVTIRNVRLDGGYIDNDNGPCANGLLLDHVTIGPGPGDNERGGEAAVSYGGYTARSVEIDRRSEGFRNSSVGDCGPVVIEDSFAKIVPPPGCGDWHGDGVQSYYGDAVTVRNTTIDMRTSGCYGTAPFFRPSGQGNQGCATIDGLLVMGQGFPFRLGTCGTVKGLQIVNNSWVFGPIDVKCSIIGSWNAQIVEITANYGLASVVRQQPCNTEGGG